MRCPRCMSLSIYFLSYDNPLYHSRTSGGTSNTWTHLFSSMKSSSGEGLLKASSLLFVEKFQN